MILESQLPCGEEVNNMYLVTFDTEPCHANPRPLGFELSRERENYALHLRKWYLTVFKLVLG